MDEQQETVDGEAEDVEVEGFGIINTTRSNIKNSAGMSLGGLGFGPSSAVAVPEATAPGIAIRENGIK